MDKKIIFYTLLLLLVLIFIPKVLAFPGSGGPLLPNIDLSNIWNYLKSFFTGNFLNNSDDLITFMRILFFILLFAIVYQVTGTIGLAWLNNRTRIVLSLIFSIIAVLFTPEVYFIFFGAEFSMIFTAGMAMASLFVLIKMYTWIGAMTGLPPLSTGLIRVLLIIVMWISINTLFASIFAVCNTVQPGLC